MKGRGFWSCELACPAGPNPIMKKGTGATKEEALREAVRTNNNDCEDCENVSRLANAREKPVPAKR